MNKKQKQVYLLIVLIFLLFIINYSFFDRLLINFLDEGEKAFVNRVIDGDTLVIHDNESVRLLGINSPEKNEKYYQEAKEFLNKKTLNKTITLKFGKDKHDRYGRLLAYVFFDGKNINLELVEEGLANFYFPSGKDQYYNDFKKAWEDCIKEEKNLCESPKDKCSDCIKLREFDYKNQKTIFYNKCDFDCELTNWIIKDEGRKKFIFPNFILKRNKEFIVSVGEKTNTESNLFWSGEDYVWTSSGDTLFLRDREGKLVLWESY